MSPCVQVPTFVALHVTMSVDVNVPTEVQLTLPLLYQRKILHDIYGGDGLVILARGLGLPLIIANLLHALNQPGALVVLLGADCTSSFVLKHEK